MLLLTVVSQIAFEILALSSFACDTISGCCFADVSMSARWVNSTESMAFAGVRKAVGAV